MYIEWDPKTDVSELKEQMSSTLATYREEYAAYYGNHALPESPKMRDPNPTVVLVPAWACSASARTRRRAASPASSI